MDVEKYRTDCQQQFSQGISLIEVIVSVFIFSLIAVAGFSGLHLGVKTHQNIQNSQSLNSNLDLLRLTLEYANQKAYSVYNLNTVKIHPNSAGQDGKTLAVLTRSKSTRPILGSDAISFLHLNLGAIYYREILPGDRQSNDSPISFCIYKPSHEKMGIIEEDKPTNFFLAISVDGYTVVEGSLGRTRKSTVCEGTQSRLWYSKRVASSIFNYTLLPSHLTASTPPTNISTLIAIEDIFTIYLDQSKTLRRISHLTTENQPIAEPYEKLHITATNSNELIQVSTQVENKLTIQSQSLHFPLNTPQASKLAWLNLIR